MRVKTLHMLAGGAFALSLAASAHGSNLLTNPGFDAYGGSGVGWTPFGNTFIDLQTSLSAPASVKMFGQFFGGFNVSGIFQEFAAAAGETYYMSSYARHNSADPLIINGGGIPNDNWVVQKLAFFDGANVEIGGAESVILDGTFATDMWHYSGLINGVAPAGTVKVQALLLFLQPEDPVGTYDPGAAFMDDIFFSDVPAPGSLAILGLGGLACARRRRR